MLKACTGYGISLNWENDTFPVALFDDLSKQSQRELVEDHLDDYGIVYPSPEGKVVTKHFDRCASYACIRAQVITHFPLLEVSTPGHYNDDENPNVIIFIRSTELCATGGNVIGVKSPEPTKEEEESINKFCELYFPNKKPAAILWAELS